jgi:conjugal transfer pilus assembly protein TraD
MKGMMLLRRYEMPWRRPIELFAGLLWSMAALAYVAMTPYRVPLRLGVVMFLVCALFAVRRIRQGLHIIGVRAALSGRAMQVIPSHDRPGSGGFWFRVRMAANPFPAFVRAGQN